MRRPLFALLALILLVLFDPFNSLVLALEPDQKLGVHILESTEVTDAGKLLPNGGYVTVPIRTDQLNHDKWQQFFDEADRAKLIPILRLATTHNGLSWNHPSRWDVIRFAYFFSTLDWHAGSLIVVAFNEPNHALEWGGKAGPDDYGKLLTFLVNWFKTESRTYIVLPAALDCAANNSMLTMDSTTFLNKLLSDYPETIKKLDGWNSHAYPNPGFNGLPTDKGKMSIRSYEYELALIKQKTNVTLPVYITETGWDRTKRTDQTISNFFQSAYQKVWQPDDAVKAVTPFLLNAQTMPFSSFSLLDRKNRPTALYETIKKLSQ